MFELQSKNPMPALDGARYRGLAYDGCFIYLTVHRSCAIIQLNECFQRVSQFHTCRAYTAICFDLYECCFWAATDEHPSIIYKLNRSMEEIDYIRVQGSKWGCTPITSLSYNCCDHSLVVAVADEVIQVYPDYPEKQSCMLKARQGLFLRVLSLCPYLICCCSDGAQNNICIYTNTGELLHKSPLPREMEIEGAIFWPCVPNGCTCRILALQTKHGCYPYLHSYTLAKDSLCNSLCCCNYDLCHQPPSPIPSPDPCADVLESIALVEAALAHILNAEGEKIQKIVACSNDVCEIMAVNESVNKTLNKVIYLEQILSCKLDSLKDCCDDGCSC